MKVSKAGIAMLKRFEGCELKAYLCPGGVWTIGVGHTGDHVHPGMEIDERTADKILRGDLIRFERGVAAACEGVDLSQCQFDALVSLAFNIGLEAFKGSTLVRLLRASDVKGAADQFLVWNKAAGRVVRGLSERRKVERSMFVGNV